MLDAYHPKRASATIRVAGLHGHRQTVEIAHLQQRLDANTLKHDPYQQRVPNRSDRAIVTGVGAHHLERLRSALIGQMITHQIESVYRRLQQLKRSNAKDPDKRATRSKLIEQVCGEYWGCRRHSSNAPV